jgi:hypothetical protein
MAVVVKYPGAHPPATPIDCSRLSCRYASVPSSRGNDYLQSLLQNQHVPFRQAQSMLVLLTCSRVSVFCATVDENGAMLVPACVLQL